MMETNDAEAAKTLPETQEKGPAQADARVSEAPETAADETATEAVETGDGDQASAPDEAEETGIVGDGIKVRTFLNTDDTAALQSQAEARAAKLDSPEFNQPPKPVG